MAALTLLQPDLGNSLALIILTLALAYMAGARVQHMARDRGLRPAGGDRGHRA